MMMTTVIGKVYYRILLVIWCAVILTLSSVPHLRTPLGAWDLILRKIAHAAVYGVLFALARAAYTETFAADGDTAAPWYRRPSYRWPVLFSIIYAISDEYHQSFVPGRVGSVWDVLIDSVGIFSAAYADLKGYSGKLSAFLKRRR